MIAKVQIAGRSIGEGEACFIIAEAGVNHNGNIVMAKKLIDKAKEAGVDAVKFQTFKAEDVTTKDAEKARYQKEIIGVKGSQFDMLKRLELTENDFEELFGHAQKEELIFLSTPFDKRSVDLLSELGVPAFKVASGEITNVPLLKHIARKKKPIILSTGMSTLNEIEKAVEVIRKEGLEEIILLHCISCYPAKVADMNLRAIKTLRCAFKLPVGLSDHTLSVITIPIASVALGGCVLEKHFTLDKNLPGPDQRASLEPKELKDMVEAVRDVERALGDGVKRPTEEEEENKLAARRSIVARVDIPKGATISEDMLTVKRPGRGMEPVHLTIIIGRRVKKDISTGELINWDMINYE